MRVVIRERNGEVSDLVVGSSTVGMRLENVTVHGTKQELLEPSFVAWSREHLLSRLHHAGHFVWVAEPAGTTFVGAGPELA